MAKLTLMVAAKKVCSIVGVNPSLITEAYFVDRKGIHQDYYIRGIVVKSYDTTIIVPDINNAEYVLSYNTTNMTTEEIISDLMVNQEFSQRDIAIFLRYSQASISRHINKEKGVIKNEEEGVDREDQKVH